jgi:hypothetical protein
VWPTTVLEKVVCLYRYFAEQRQQHCWWRVPHAISEENLEIVEVPMKKDSSYEVQSRDVGHGYFFSSIRLQVSVGAGCHAVCSGCAFLSMPQMIPRAMDYCF